jgi:PAS domain S-box-containing protein
MDAAAVKSDRMDQLVGTHLAFVGGGAFCQELLAFLLGAPDETGPPAVLAVADLDLAAPGARLAREHGIRVVSDYHRLLELPGLTTVVEITNDDRLSEILRAELPPAIRLIDHIEVRVVWDALHLLRLRSEALQRLRGMPQLTTDIEILVADLVDRISAIAEHRGQRACQIERELVEQRRTLAQIIEGSTIPTFVIDQDHVITHWNLAMERLTGSRAREMVGTRRQSVPFWHENRPSMADVVVDQLGEAEMQRLYGDRWCRSALIADAYEAQVFFDKLGPGGRWCWFTAAPIKSADGRVVGAVETIQDITPQKQAAEERERQNQRLAESERLQAQIVQGSTIPTFVIDRNHIVTHWNRALERLTGMPGTRMVGTSDHWRPFRENPRPLMADVILDQLPEEEIHRLYGANWRPSSLLDGAYEAEEFLPLLGENGKWCWFTAAPIIDPNGHVVGAIETLQDVSEAKQAEEERRRHAHLLATLVSIYTALNQPQSIDARIDAALHEIQAFLGTDQICLFILDADRQWCLKSQHGTASLGSDSRICGPDSIVQEAARQGRVTIYNRLPDGIEAELGCMRQAGIQSLAYIPIRTAEDEIFGVIRMGSRHADFFSAEELYTLELTGNRIGATMENALLQEELRRKTNFQSKLIRSSTDAIVATDEQMRIVVFNPEAERLFGYRREQVVNQLRAFDLYPDQVEQLWDAEADRNRSWEFPWQEVTVTHRGGEVIPVRYSGTILHEDDRPMGSVAFFQDLRPIKRLEHELLQAERLAAVGQTVAGMAHCIKNILHGFKGGSYLMRIGIDRADPDKMRSGWRMVERNIGRISDLVLDLLSYSKEREPELAPCEPNAVAGEVCDLMAEVAEESRVEIVRRFAGDLGPAVLDARIVHRALLNLLSNAIDACALDPDLDKRHRVWVRTARAPSGTISFEVEDNGMGMSAEVKGHLFTSFYSTKGSRGTGLGMLVTRKLVEEHRGRIEVWSEPGVGTRVTVFLPADMAPAAVPAATQADKPSMPGG